MSVSRRICAALRCHDHILQERSALIQKQEFTSSDRHAIPHAYRGPIPPQAPASTAPGGSMKLHMHYPAHAFAAGSLPAGGAPVACALCVCAAASSQPSGHPIATVTSAQASTRAGAHAGGFVAARPANFSQPRSRSQQWRRGTGEFPSDDACGGWTLCLQSFRACLLVLQAEDAGSGCSQWGPRARAEGCLTAPPQPSQASAKSEPAHDGSVIFV